MQLHLLHPEVAHRDCGQCQEFFFEEDGPQAGQMRLDRRGEPQKRPPGTAAPCRRSGMTCPKGTPEQQVTLSEQHRKAFRHYQRCKLTGQWPDDEWVVERGILLDQLMESIKFRRLSESISASLAPLMVR